MKSSKRHATRKSLVKHVSQFQSNQLMVFLADRMGNRTPINSLKISSTLLRTVLLGAKQLAIIKLQLQDNCTPS